MIVSLHVTYVSAGFELFQSLLKELDRMIRTHMCTNTSVNEYLILKTCNRFEFYAVTENPDLVRDLESLMKLLLIDDSACKPYFILCDEESVKHLFRVAASLESMVLGEDQIQGQIREAYVRAKGEGHIGKTLTRLFERTLYVGKKVRAETMLNEGSVSVASVAVDCVESELGSLKDKVVSIYGAGDMAIAVARSLSDKGPKTLFISSRTYDRAKKLADELKGSAVSISFIQDTIAKSDVFIVATSAPHILIFKDRIEKAMEGRDGRLLIVDISMPRNVDDAVSQVDNVKLITMENIDSVANRNMENRISEITVAEDIVNEEFRRYCVEDNQNYVDEVIKGLTMKIQAIRDEELDRAISRMASVDNHDMVLRDFSNALVSKIMAEPYHQLRESSIGEKKDICDILVDLFGVKRE